MKLLRTFGSKTMVILCLCSVLASTSNTNGDGRRNGSNLAVLRKLFNPTKDAMGVLHVVNIPEPAWSWRPRFDKFPGIPRRILNVLRIASRRDQYALLRSTNLSPPFE